MGQVDRSAAVCDIPIRVIVSNVTLYPWKQGSNPSCPVVTMKEVKHAYHHSIHEGQLLLYNLLSFD